MKEDQQRSQIHQRNAPPPSPPVIPALPKVSHQWSSSSTSSSTSNIPNYNQTVPTFWPNGPIVPPPYPPPPFVVGQEPIYYSDQHHNWAIGLFDCFSDIKISFLVLLCPCVAFGKIAEIVNEGETIWTEPGSLYCFLYIVQVGFMEIVDFMWFHIFKDRCIGSMSYQGWIIGFILATFYNGLYRTKIRKQWNLKGSLTSDYCLHLFCHQCALCQQYRQLEHQGFIVFQGWERNKERFRQAMTTMYPHAPPLVQEMSR